MRFSLSCFDPLPCFLTPSSQHLSQWQGLWRVLLTESVKINNIISTLSQFSINEFEVHHSRHIHHIRSASKTSDQTRTWCNTTHSKQNLESLFRNNRSTNDQGYSCMSQFESCILRRMCFTYVWSSAAVIDCEGWIESRRSGLWRTFILRHQLGQCGSCCLATIQCIVCFQAYWCELSYAPSVTIEVHKLRHSLKRRGKKLLIECSFWGKIISQDRRTNLWGASGGNIVINTSMVSIVQPVQHTQHTYHQNLIRFQ